jgi:hypothetical protein
MKDLHTRPLVSAVLIAACLLSAGCRTLSPQSFAGAEPRFEPDKFFEGPTRSWGVIESRSGVPKRRFRTEMMGRREGDVLVITQDFTFEDGQKQQRVWRLRRIDDHRYEATANDVVGVSHGLANGNSFYWEYTLALRPGNPLANVRFKLWMYLQADGETMINRVSISKLGVIVAHTTEHFHRGSGSVPSITQAGSERAERIQHPQGPLSR